DEFSSDTLYQPESHDEVQYIQLSQNDRVLRSLVYSCILFILLSILFAQAGGQTASHNGHIKV
ncbi:hypothetical protein, partial [Pseudoalteromonas sp. S1612]|uniref:hypothetical protein n=1 Tax=Pseudoalteromonas sp. S1612 TaxID=579507 RepID=UPI00126D6828